ncbi:MAG: hypothetical protein M3459_10605, partial [Actinomycetota bacterium]|nr:hypothetical protein [Actinomycetota bacterium]
MDPDRLPSLGARIRWGNVARALALLAAVALVVAWPRLTPSEPALPPPPPEPLAVAPMEEEAQGGEFEGSEVELEAAGDSEEEGREGRADGSRGDGDREARRGAGRGGGGEEAGGGSG